MREEKLLLTPLQSAFNDGIETAKTVIKEYSIEDYCEFDYWRASLLNAIARKVNPYSYNAAPVPSEQVETCDCKGSFHVMGCPQTAAIDAERAQLNGSGEQEVTPEHSPLLAALPWEVGSRYNELQDRYEAVITSEARDVAILETYYQDDAQNAAYIVEAVNSYAELKGRVRSLEAAMVEIYETLPTTIPITEHFRQVGNWGLTELEYKIADIAARAALSKGDSK